MHSALLLLLKYKYAVIFPLAAFEGPVVSLVVGFLVYSGVLNFWLALIILILGDIIPDTLFYFIGYFGQQSPFIQKHFLKADFFKNHFSLVKKLWQEHPAKTMFFGKLALGMALPFLVSAGIVKLPYKKFISLTIPISVFQYTLLTSVGYYLGSSYNLAVGYVKNVYLFVAAFIIIFAIIYFLIARYTRNKIILMEDEDK